MNIRKAYNFISNITQKVVNVIEINKKSTEAIPSDAGLGSIVVDVDTGETIRVSDGDVNYRVLHNYIDPVTKREVYFLEIN